MGAWSTSLFGSDTACDVRDAYVDLLRSGLTGKQATRQMLEDWAAEIDDADDGPDFWLALAVTQWKYGRLEPRVKAKAMRVITSKADLERWDDPKLVRQRQRMLEKIAEQLKSPQPAEKPVRVQKAPEPLKKIERLWKPGQVVAYRLTSRTLVLLLTEGARVEEYHGHIPYFVLLNWTGATVPSADEIRSLPVTELVYGVWPYRRGQTPPMDRIERLDVYLPLTGRIIFGRTWMGGVWAETNWKEFDSRLQDALRALKRKAK